MAEQQANVEQIANLETAKAALNAEIAQLQQTKANITGEIDGLNKTKEATTSEINTLQTNKCAIEEQISNAKKELLEVEEEIKKKKTPDEREANIIEQENHYLELNTMFEQLVKQNEENKTIFEAKQTELQKSLDESKILKEHLDSENNKLDVTMKQTETLKKEYEIKIQDAKDAIASYEKQRKIYEDQNKLIIAAQNVLQMQIKREKEKYTENQKLIENSKIIYQKFEQQNEQLNNLLDKTKEERELLSKQKDEFEKNNEEVFKKRLDNVKKEDDLNRREKTIKCAELKIEKIPDVVEEIKVEKVEKKEDVPPPQQPQ
ncbi:M protein, serotype 24 precursor, putative [Entamoeba invadens IP1]|uniref:M protein, serotype 24, putative n=2 Tax=Entamoeba invadens TaxID=33085 RepID=A0A0A1U1C3_ENTIV|nr:M protein, serotype 24 precursor, putative [Entamoeba invadens IP1]ELP87807.1 M protein, serotype 24 precursor, putative [Entamoeba invadens IP1]BAN41506.1 M protein, serotype 24 precursor, putative [Entamoeba invadens]|eukprot:XP_004254578.1 M protein, serotype 24 precursor, putative [Entamoeba invadens IP1]